MDENAASANSLGIEGEIAEQTTEWKCPWVYANENSKGSEEPLVEEQENYELAISSGHDVP